MSTKKPSKPIVVGNNKYYKYLIVWEDIVGDSTITDFNEFTQMTCALIHTEAYIFKKTSKYLYSFGSYQNDNGEIGFGDRNIYPRSVIKKMLRI